MNNATHQSPNNLSTSKFLDQNGSDSDDSEVDDKINDNSKEEETEYIEDTNKINDEDMEIINMFKIKDRKKIKVVEKKEIIKNEDLETDSGDSDTDDISINKDSAEDDFINFDTNNNWNNAFDNSANELEEMMNNKIEIKTQARGRKTTTVVVGLILNKEKEKEFLKSIKKKMAATGTKKSVTEDELSMGSYHKDKSKRGQPKDRTIPRIDIFLFTGNCKDTIKNILISDFDISEESIIC
jgi:translation initiation factor 1 (eIF-1/SUI1)